VGEIVVFSMSCEKNRKEGERNLWERIRDQKGRQRVRREKWVLRDVGEDPKLGSLLIYRWESRVINVEYQKYNREVAFLNWVGLMQGIFRYQKWACELLRVFCLFLMSFLSHENQKAKKEGM